MSNRPQTLTPRDYEMTLEEFRKLMKGEVAKGWVPPVSPVVSQAEARIAERMMQERVEQYANGPAPTIEITLEALI